MPAKDLLKPPETKPHTSVVHVPEQWYIACRSRELRRKPIARAVLGIPLVLFRGPDGIAAALLDRCAHRNVPLSAGSVEEDLLQCGYHGWRFDVGGVCRDIPGLCGDPSGPARRVPAYATVEQDGYVWVYATPDVEPVGPPFSLPLIGVRGYTTVQRTLDMPGSLHATLENALDVPHTGFLHSGLFRGSGEPNEIEVVVRRWSNRVEAEFIGEPRPSGLVGRLLAPGGGQVAHFDRFFLPSIAQVEYRIGERSHLMVTSVCTPLSDFETRMHASVSFRLPIPGWLVKPFLLPIALRILKQDAAVLEAQAGSIHEFGGEQFASTEIDVLGSHILRLLRSAQRGEISGVDDEPPVESTVRLRA